MHEHNPDAKSPEDEMCEADKHLQRWFKNIPELYICLGNHDRLLSRQAVKNGLPNRAIRPLNEVYKFPKGWKVAYNWEFDGVRYIHGTGLSGYNAHRKAAELGRQSTVIGHTHSGGGQISYLVSENDRIWGMNVGCGIDRNAIAFQYGRDLLKKPVLGCGVVTDKGNYCQFFPMSL